MLDRVTDMEGQRRTFVHNNRGLEARRTGNDGGLIITDWHPEVTKPTTITEPEQVTALDYDSRYRLTTRTLSERYGEGERVWTYTYHPASNGVPGQLATVDGPRTDVADVTSFDYNAQGNLDTVTNALGHATSFQGYDAHGRPQTVIDPNGVTWTLAYDVRGRLESMAGPTGSFGFTFDDAGLLIEETQPNGVTLTYEYDDAQRVVATVDAMGNRLERNLNALGDPLAMRLMDGQGTEEWSESRTYGENGWLLAITNALGYTTALSYDRVANLTGEEDPAGDAYQYEYDGFHHRTEVVDPLGEAAAFRFEDTGDLTQVTDFGGERTFYTRNGFGEAIRVNSPDSGITDYTFDEAGNLATRTDALGQVTTYEYDALNRLTRMSTDDPAEADVVIRYDEAGAGHGVGRMTTVIDGVGETTFDYTASGDVNRESRTQNGDTSYLAYTYDGAGQVETITYPSGRVVTYERDAIGEVVKVTTTAPDGTETVLANQIERAPFGPITSLQHGNGLSETRALDQAYQVVSVTVPGVHERDYTYTVDANVAGIDDLLASARTQAFGYDPADRLTEADGAYGDFGFEYDANTNRTAKIDDGQRDDYRINFSNNWLLETETADYRYDNAGNTLEKGADTYVYDTHHRLTEATVDGITATYAYNVQHQRVSKSVGGTTTRFFYGQGGELLSEMVVGTGLTAAEYVWLDGRPLAYITDRQVYQVHTDHLGTPQVLTDASGAAVWEAEYRPFGEAVTTGSVSFPLRFPGQYHDGETGFHYN
jgi:YD repeat-containing protein